MTSYKINDFHDFPRVILQNKHRPKKYEHKVQLYGSENFLKECISRKIIT